MQVVLEICDVGIQVHCCWFPFQLLNLDPNLLCLEGRCEAIQEESTELGPSLHIVGELVGAVCAWGFVDIGSCPVSPNRSHDLCFMPVCCDTVGGESCCAGCNHAVACFVIGVHVSIGHGDEPDSRRSFVSGICCDVGEQGFCLFHELVSLYRIICMRAALN
jgi:hypothetical protein